MAVLPFALEPLPLGSIKPTGWLRNEMQLMADGLAGHQYDFYTYVANSSWLGGSSEYSGLNEGFPYWFNGLVPLAYGLDDDRLKDQIDTSVRTVISLQQDDGWLGPETGTARNLWARFPLFLGLAGLVDADPVTYETLVVPAMHKFVQLMHDMLQNNYTGYLYHDGDQVGPGDTPWGRVRMADMLISLQWMYENHPQNNSQILFDNMNFLYNASLDWAKWYVNGTYIKQDLFDVPGTGSADPTVNTLYPFEHGVNVGQGLKAGAVVRRFIHNDSLADSSRTAVNWTFEYHGAASGTILADERLDGLSPYYGSELCTVVEAIYSLSYLYHALGDASFADKCELAAFNALPVMFTPDWWAHQYVTQPNQPYSKELARVPFSNTRGWSQTFGLEPNYPCCTVNHPQGFPKFLAAAWAKTPSSGLAHTLLSPTNVTTSIDGNDISIQCDTQYPFANVFTYTTSATSAFDLYVRVPGWYVSQASSISISSLSGLESKTEASLQPDPHTGLHRVSIPAGSHRVMYYLDATIITEPRANDTIAVHYGALLYALVIGSTNTSTSPKSFADDQELPAGYAPEKSRDYQMFNSTAWNIAIDPNTLKLVPRSNTDEPLAKPIFAPGAPPQSITALGCEIEWPLFGSTPGSPIPKENRKCISSPYNVTLMPYGSTKLHMAELPTIDLV